MAFENTWRWFGPNEPYSLTTIKQTGVTGIVTALHQIPVGNVWSVEEITERKNIIEEAGMTWSVVESVPVHEDIKKKIGDYKEYIDNYKQTLRNLAKCNIDTVCYNFMPILDWSRTNLHVKNDDNSISTNFNYTHFAAFDLYILKRANAERDYSDEIKREAIEYFNTLNDEEKNALTNTVLLGLPGSLEAYDLENFRKVIEPYQSISEDEVRDNLIYFLKEVLPVAEEVGIYLTIHPDDPPMSLLGLPRVVGSADAIQKILDAYPSPNNGLTFCTGSLGAGHHNNLTELAEKFADRINFVHLRNVTRNENKDFAETNHLEGDIDLYSIIKTLLIEQKRRKNAGRKDFRLPMRPDHGNLMTPEFETKNIYPGYSLMGRMKGLAEIRGIEYAIIRNQNI